MDTMTNYQTLIKTILTDYHQWVSGASNLTDESCLIFDDENDHYLWLFLGWEGKKKVRNIQIHIRLKQGKIWIEEDWTEEGITNELLNKGVPKSDIVLAFHPPDERHLTEFATA